MPKQSFIPRYTCFFTVLCMLMPFSALAEETLKDRFPKDLLNNDKKYYFTLTVENDLFGKGTDQNYTNGIRLGWFEAGEKPLGITNNLEKILPFLDINETTSVAYSVGHNLYTPKAVESPLQDPNDRPWASFLYSSIAMATLAKNHLDEYEITLGVVGPLALGEPIQKKWHKLINSTTPRGWDNQIKNEPGIILSWQRRWPETWYADLGGTFLSFTPHAGVTAGNIYTYANAGSTIKFSPENNRWADKPLSVRPSIPGTGYFPASERMGWELFLGLEGRAVARNIFLDGNTFADSHSVDRKILVADASAGVALTWGQTRLSYTLVYRTKEFNKQDDAAIFGAVSLGYNF
jgi:lipid A 3-O-deacylase